ncbi:MAG: hypothetical protein Fur0016_09290 [Anaerolineales bacterium]
MKKSTLTALFLLVVILFGLAPVAHPAAAATRCDWVQFVADVTVPDGATYKAGDSFNKTWRVKNIGSCTWSTDYSLVFVNGAQMSAPASVKLPNSVAPGQTIDLTVSMTAPNAAGTHRGNWQLKNASGVLFGIGTNADKSFWVEIKVSGAPGATGYDFAENAASATWTSGAGTLTFPGSEGDAKGFVRKLDAPKLETGATSTLPGLLMVPQNVTDGYIQGVFPAFRVQSGDRFQATIGCEHGATSCWVNFRLQYQIGNGAVQTLWSFNEKYEGLVYRANLDLSRLAGQDVKFILRINAAGPAAGDRALWGSPQIVRGGGTTPPTVTPGPSSTPTSTPVPGACTDRIIFVADVTVPDGTTFAPNTNFNKTWRVKNVGTCTFNINYYLVYVSGDKLGTTEQVKFTSTIAPNTTFDLSVNLTSPAANGTYRGYWQLKNDKGQTFGIGTKYDKPFWVEIKVSGGVTPVPTTPVGPTITPISQTTNFDFVEYSGSAATWSSGAGELTLPGTDGDAKGFVIVKPNGINMETGQTDGRPALLTVPQNINNGYIQGVYLPVKVQQGDRFQATIGCEQGATNCYVTYRLEYQIGSDPVKVFWAFNEKYEGLVYNVNLDLSSLAGKDVKFILKVLAAGPAANDRAVWINPRIVRTAGGATAIPATGTPVPDTATPQPTATATIEPTATATP